MRDRVSEGAERIRFSSAILPPYARRSKSLEVLIPILYLKGISTGEFEEALVALSYSASPAANPDHASGRHFFSRWQAGMRRRSIRLDRCEATHGATRMGLVCRGRRLIGHTAPRLMGQTA